KQASPRLPPLGEESRTYPVLRPSGRDLGEFQKNFPSADFSRGRGSLAIRMGRGFSGFARIYRIEGVATSAGSVLTRSLDSVATDVDSVVLEILADPADPRPIPPIIHAPRSKMAP